MASPSLMEGVFAINKPTSITSAQVVRDLQRAFNPSRLFAPCLAAETAARSKENAFQRKRRRHKQIQVKIGHGGTLDPLATGVLIIGVGRGTKQLARFIQCTKSYDVTLLFGAATDTYDITGRTVAKAPHHHISRESLEGALQAFRGDVMQKPPIYSAVHMQGKRLMEYARQGLELPAEILARPVTVKELTLTEWMEPESHDMRLPVQEAEDIEKAIASKLLHLKRTPEAAPAPEHLDPSEGVAASPNQDAVNSGSSASSSIGTKARAADHGASQIRKVPEGDEHGAARNEDADKAPAPLAVRLHMTVTSGFYVRSLCHDLGKALGSLGLMAKLSRTRQGRFKLGQNVLDYEDLAKGEDVWGPQVKSALDDWNLSGTSDSEVTT